MYHFTVVQRIERSYLIPRTILENHVDLPEYDVEDPPENNRMSIMNHNIEMFEEFLSSPNTRIEEWVKVCK
jgi:hypothetical protein